MKKVWLFVSCGLALAQFQACKAPTTVHSSAPELSSLISTTPLPSGTVVHFSPSKNPLIKHINTGTPINFKTIQEVVVDGKILIPNNSTALGSIVKIESKGSYNADIVTIRMEYVTAIDGQIIALAPKDVMIKVNLHDAQAYLFHYNFSSSALVAQNSYIRLGTIQ